MSGEQMSGEQMSGIRFDQILQSVGLTDETTYAGETERRQIFVTCMFKLKVTKNLINT